MLVVPHLSPPMMIRLGSCGVAFAAPPEAALAVGGVALAGTRAHRLVGGVHAGPPANSRPANFCSSATSSPKRPRIVSKRSSGSFGFGAGGFSGSWTTFSTIQRIDSGRRSKLRSKERKPGSLISFSMNWYLSPCLALDFSHSRSNCSEVKLSSTPAKANALRIVSSRSVCSSSWVMISICSRSKSSR